MLCADRSGKALQGAGISVLKVMGAQQGRRRLQYFAYFPMDSQGRSKGLAQDCVLRCSSEGYQCIFMAQIDCNLETLTDCFSWSAHPVLKAGAVKPDWSES